MAKSKTIPKESQLRDILNLTPAISRAVEIAIFGGLQICFLVETYTDHDTELKDYVNRVQNTMCIKRYYSKAFNSQAPYFTDSPIEAHIILEVKGTFTPDHLIGINPDTPRALLERVENARKYWKDKEPASLKLQGANLELLKKAIHGLELNIQELQDVVHVAEVIAALGMYEEVRPEHLAEAVMYKSSKGELMRGQLIPYTDQLMQKAHSLF